VFPPGKPPASASHDIASAQPHRRTVLHGLAGIAVAPFAIPRRAVGAQSFLVLGDWGRRGAETQRRVAAAMGAAALERDSRFVISTGDNFYPCGVRSIRDPQWKSSFEDVYTAPSLQRPWFVALGNHDYRGVPRAQLEYSRVSPRWRMPSRYFTVGPAESGIADLDIFVLDTTPMIFSADETVQQLAHGHVSSHRGAVQLAWVEQELASSTARWKIVIGHHPIHSGSHGDTRELVDHVKPLLEAYGVQAYVNGHDHNLQHIRRGSIDYICSGSGAEAGSVGAVNGTRFRLARPGFAVFTAGPDALSFAFCDLDGRRVYESMIGAARAA